MAYTIPRSNHELAATVDQGIVIAELFSYSEGFAYMRDNHVPLDVALRVLSGPEQRRTYRR